MDFDKLTDAEKEIEERNYKSWVKEYNLALRAKKKADEKAEKGCCSRRE